MNKFTFALLSTAVLGQNQCETTEDCAGVTDGCCMRVEITSIPADAYWGAFSFIWGGDDQMVVGNSLNGCADQTYMDAHLAANPDGVTSNYDDLANYLENVDGTKEIFGLQPSDTVEEWLTAWDGDAYT